MATRLAAIALLALSCAASAVEFPLKGATLDGGVLAIDPAQRQRPALLVFWASWCAPCQREMPALVALQRAAGASIDVVSCSIDADGAAAQASAREHGLNYPVILDGDMAIADRFAVEATPTIIVLGADGREIARGRSLGQVRPALAGLGIAPP